MGDSNQVGDLSDALNTPHFLMFLESSNNR